MNDVENKINELMSSLTEDEKRIVNNILKEFGEQGKSLILEKLKYRDYKEIPVDIMTFITDDNYLGKAWRNSEGKLKVYPFWLDILKKLFPTNIDTNYSMLLETGARGIGKSEIACGIIAPYLLYRILCLKDPASFYDIKSTEKITFAFMNIKLELTEEIALDKFQKNIQLSPWFMSKGKMTTYKNSPYWIPPEPLELVIGSQSDDVVGRPIFFAFLDELSFIRNQDIDKQKQKAKDMVDTARGGMVTRFIRNGKNPTLMCIASSKRSEQSFMESYIKTIISLEDSSALIVDKPVWEVKPKGEYGEGIFYVGLGNKYLSSVVIPDGEDLTLYKEKGYKILEVPRFFKKAFLEDLDRQLCDIAGVSVSSTNKYMSPESVRECIHEDFKNPFPDVLTIGNDKNDLKQYYNFFNLDNIPQSYKEKPLFIHLDMSISGDMTGIAGVWIIGKKHSTDDNQSKDLIFRLAFSVSIEAPKGHQISFEKNRNFIRWLRTQNFNIVEITSDTFQSYDLQQQLTAEGFKCSILSVDRVQDGICKPYQYLKSTVYEKRLQMYKSERLFDEFVDVERNINTGKVDHTPNFHKDALDAVCGATFTASKYAEEFAYDYGENYEIIDEVNDNISNNVQQQMILDFEEELKKLALQNSNLKNMKEQEPVQSQKDKDFMAELVGYDNDILIW